MKTSNKILLGSLIVVVLLISSLHIAIYAKYKNGEITVVDPKSGRYTTHQLKGNIRYVRANGLTRFVIYPSDTLKLRMQNNVKRPVTFKIVMDTLIIDATNTAEPQRRDYQEVFLFLPSAEKIVAEFTDMEIEGAEDSISATSYSVELTNATCRFGSSQPGNIRFFNNISVTARNNSNLVLTDQIFVNTLNLTARASGMEAGDATIRQFTVTADNASHFKISGKLMQAIRPVAE